MVAGFGMVGCKVVEQDTLKRAKARDASAIILALSDDSESVFATAVVRDYAPEVPLIVRVLRTPVEGGCAGTHRSQSGSG